jgi:hypothetical protein
LKLAELAAATAEIEATLLELKCERLLAHLASSTDAGNGDAAGPGAASTAADAGVASPDAEASVRGELLHSAGNHPGNVHIGEEHPLGAALTCSACNS